MGGGMSGNPDGRTWYQSNGQVNLSNMCFKGDVCLKKDGWTTSANYKCCRGFKDGKAMGLNFCLDVTDKTNSNTYGTTYGYESLGDEHSKAGVMQLNYNCDYAHFVKGSGANMMLVSAAAGVLTSLVNIL